MQAFCAGFVWGLRRLIKRRPTTEEIIPSLIRAGKACA